MHGTTNIKLLAGRPKKRSSIPKMEKRFFILRKLQDWFWGSPFRFLFNCYLEPLPPDKITGLWYRVPSFYSRGEKWVDVHCLLYFHGAGRDIYCQLLKGNAHNLENGATSGAVSGIFLWNTTCKRIIYFASYLIFRIWINIVFNVNSSTFTFLKKNIPTVYNYEDVFQTFCWQSTTLPLKQR